MSSQALNDEDVNQLYRCLLGRAPESADTIAAFRAYYPDFTQGRLAILGSDEFRRVYREKFTYNPQHEPDPIAIFTREMLARLAPSVGGGRYRAAAPAIAQIFARNSAIKFAVMLTDGGEEIDLDSLAPLGPQGTILMLQNAGSGAAIRKTARCSTGVFTLPLPLRDVDELLRAGDLKIDILYLLDAPDGEAAVRHLLGHLAERALVVLGGASRELAPLISSCRDDVPSFELDEICVFSLGGWCLPVVYETPATPPGFTDWRHAPTLALAAIMRNEEVAIANMLRSVLPLIQFCALIDTGSSDNTIAAARAVLEDSGVEYVIKQIPRGNFDAMRNSALNQIPDWVAWVLMLDADEEIVAEDYAGFLRLMRDDHAQAYALPRYNFTTAEKLGENIPYPDRQTRLLRNCRAAPPRYSGVVHESVCNVPVEFVALDARAVGGGRGGPHIHHLVRRFRTPAEEAAKQDFYRDLAISGGAAREVV